MDLNLASGLSLGAQAPWRICRRNHGNSSGGVPTDVSPHSRVPTSSTEEAEPLDIWAVIKPGHVREKIALFGWEGRWTEDTPSPGLTWDRDEDTSGLFRLRKSKGNWEERGGAKRQRHFRQQSAVRTALSCWRRQDQSPADGGGAQREGEEPKLSVVDMVACLEKRFCRQQRDTKPELTLHTSSASLMFRAPPPEPDALRVSDMVARLESDRLRTRMDTPGKRRTVGRVLLVTPDVGSAPCRPSALSSPPAPQRGSGGAVPAPVMATPPTGHPAEVASDPPSRAEEAEPPPGLLFRSPPPPETLGRAPLPGGVAAGQVGGACVFLQVRERVQQLLEPRPTLTLLPHHLLLHVLSLLPTRSLAALKCSCRYFRLVIDTYGVRPADALWVSDPCYSDDPCKQCKRRYGRGDVSLCRWHHKPFCQALPYGPGYWMCCRGNHKDTPGCNVGLHDNRWVPAFHSRNVPICRWSQQEE